jgi:hypothetical protein
MVSGFVILPFFLAESVVVYCRGLFTEHGIDLIVTWATVFGPYVAYLAVRSIVWLIEWTVLFIRTIGYVVEVSHEPKALAAEERLSGRFSTGEAGLAEKESAFL